MKVVYLTIPITVTYAFGLNSGLAHTPSRSRLIVAKSPCRHPVVHVAGRPVSSTALMNNAGVVESDSAAIQELLKKQKVVEKNPSVSPLSSLLPMVMETKLYPEEGTIVFNKGDKSNGLFFVKEGTFNCIDGDGAVVKELQQGDIFGEVGLFLSEARALTVQSATPYASLYFVDGKSYNLVSKLKDSDDEVLQSNLQNEYSEYMDFRKKKAALKRFKALQKEFTEDEIDIVAKSLTRCAYEAGEDIFLKGESESNEMYFVESGTYEVLGAEGDFENQKYFGELGFFLRRPRVATIRASSPVTLFKLSREDLLIVVDESRLETETLTLLAEDYRDAGFVGKYNDVVEYIKVKNRPKKELVSFHSTLATAATGMYLCGMVPCISPGFNDNGVPQFFNLDNFGLGLPETQLMMLLFAIIGLTGSFRLPPNSPLLRRHFFNFTVLEVIANYMLQDSNAVAVNEGSRYTFDLLTVNPGSISFWIVLAMSNLWAMKLISEAMVADNKARSVTPLNGQAAAIAISTGFVGLLMMQEIPGCFFTMDKVAYADLFLPFAQTHYKNFVLTQFLSAQVGMSIYMLLATLLFERKITQHQCSLLVIPVFEPLIEQSVAVSFEFFSNAETMAYGEYNNLIFGHFHIYQILTLLYAGAAIHGLINRHETKKAAALQ